MENDSQNPPITEQQDDAARDRSKELSLGAPPPGYELIEPLGRGAFGEVWKARQTSTGKDVAIKAFFRFHGLDWQFLRIEVQRLVELDAHPHIVSLLDAQLEREPPSYVMELVRGGSLGALLRKGTHIPIEQAVRWFTQIAGALTYVHDKGVLHCDLKPDNILVDEHDSVRLVDFGQSRLVTDASSALGTLMFMAPEQAVVADVAAARHADVRWDVYAMGATAHTLLTGQAPHVSQENEAALSKAASLEEKLSIYRRIVEQAVLPLQLKTKDGQAIDADLAAIVRTCLAPRAEDRYPSAQEVKRELKRRATHYPVRARRGGFGYRARKLVRRRTARVIALLAMLMISAGTVVGLRWHRIEQERNARVADLVTRGIQFTNEKRWPAAEDAFQGALALSPGDFEAVANYGRMFQLRAEDPNEDHDLSLNKAVSVHRLLREIEPGDPQIINAIAASYYQEGKYRDAIEYYLQIANESDGFYPVWVNLALAYVRSDDVDHAEEAARTATDMCDQIIEAIHRGLQPEIQDSEQRCRNAYQTLGTILLLKRDSDAIDYFERSLKSDSRQSKVWIKLARARLTLEGRLDAKQALKDLTVAESMADDAQSLDPLLSRFRALAHLNLGAFDKAIESAQQAIEAGDLSTPNDLVLACAWSDQGGATKAGSFADRADAEWPSQLENPGDYYLDQSFWFESYDELAWLRTLCGSSKGDE